jgi:hypothetical protein
MAEGEQEGRRGGNNGEFKQGRGRKHENAERGGKGLGRY